MSRSTVDVLIAETVGIATTVKPGSIPQSLIQSTISWLWSEPSKLCNSSQDFCVSYSESSGYGFDDFKAAPRGRRPRPLCR